MKLKRLSLTACIIALSMAGSVALAQTPSFEEMDRNGDGLIGKSEAMALPCLARAFNEVDKEDPEGLNRGEYQKAVQKHCPSTGDQDWPEP